MVILSFVPRSLLLFFFLRKRDRINDGKKKRKRKRKGKKNSLGFFFPSLSLPLCSLPLCSLPLRSLPLRSLPLCSLPLRSLPLRSLPFCSFKKKKKKNRSIELSSTAANALLPDGSASYWVTPLVEAGGGQPLIPLDGKLEIHGRFPSARYFSFVSYTATGLVFDSVSDFEIPPQVAGTNPFATRGAAPGAPYSLRLVEANGTQAAASGAAGETVLLVPKGAGSVVYRIYGADPGTNATGKWLVCGVGWRWGGLALSLSLALARSFFLLFLSSFSLPLSLSPSLPLFLSFFLAVLS